MKSRLFSLLIAVVLSRFGLCQGDQPIPEKKVSYTTVAVPLARAFGEIGKGVGVKFEVDDSMAQEPVILRLDEVPLKEVMDRVASMEGAEWKAADGGFMLFRSSDDVARLTAADGARREAAIKKSIDGIAATAAREGRMTAAKAEDLAQKVVLMQKQQAAGVSPIQNSAIRSALLRASPNNRALAQILSSFDPAELAALRPGGRYVYASNPTAMQRPLPEIDPDLLKQCFEDQNLLNDNISAQLKKWGIAPEMLQRYQHLEEPPVRVRVVIRPFVGVNRLLAEVSFIAADGQIVDGIQRAVAQTWDPLVQRPKESKFQFEAGKQGVAVSKPVLDLMHRLNTVGSDPDLAPALTPEMIQTLTTPTEHDPLSVVTSECVLGLAAKENVNAIFLPSDGDEQMSMFACRTAFVTWDLFQLELLRLDDLDLELRDGWLTGTPRSPMTLAFYRWPRPALEQFAKSVETEGAVSIDQDANLMLAAPHGIQIDYPRYLVDVLLGPTAPQEDMGSEEGLRLWGSLSGAQRGLARRTALTLSLDQLDANQRSLCDDFVYLGFKSLDLEPEAYKGLSPDQRQTVYENSMEVERTEVFPNGVPPEASLEFKDSAEPKFFFDELDSHGHKMQNSGELNELASDYAMLRRVDLFPVAATMQIDHIRMGMQRKLEIVAHMGGKYRVREEMTESHGPAGKGVSLDQILTILPDDLKDEFNKRVNELLEMYKKARKSDLDWINGDPAAPVQPPLPFRF